MKRPGDREKKKKRKKKHRDASDSGDKFSKVLYSDFI